MYCIIKHEYEHKMYLAFQNTGEGIEYGYYFTDKETFLSNLSNNKRKHPTLFKTMKDAITFTRWITSVRTGYSYYEFGFERIDSRLLSTCDMDCFACNKKYKYKCHHLRNPYQNYCGFIMARFSDEFEPDKNRLDAPCESCLTRGCPYNMNNI